MDIISIDNLQMFIENIIEINKLSQNDKDAFKELKENTKKVYNLLRNIVPMSEPNVNLIPIFLEKFYSLYGDKKNAPDFVIKFLEKVSDLIYIEDLINLSNKIEKIYKDYEYEIVYRAPTKKENYDYIVEKELPSLFRTEILEKSEDNIYKDFLASNPDKFNNMTTFDILTKMRHYEVPNRLLDVTYDPLLALYFACGKKNEEDHYNGSNMIFLYKVNKSNIKYFDSDTVTILSVLTKLKNTDRQRISSIVEFFVRIHDIVLFEKCISFYRTKIFNKNFIKQAIDVIQKNFFIKENDLLQKIEDENIKISDIAEDLFNKLDDNLQIEKIKKTMLPELLSSLKKIIENFGDYPIDSYEYLKDIFNRIINSFVPELSWQLKNEKFNWNEGFLKIETFMNCYLVKPKMNNPRIIAQSGAFFIYPFKNINIKTALTKNEPYRIFKINNIQQIKKEIESLNIKSTKYMPDDLTVYAEEIREKYKNA